MKKNTGNYENNFDIKFLTMPIRKDRFRIIKLVIQSRLYTINIQKKANGFIFVSFAKE